MSMFAVPGLGNVGFNWYGSHPTHLADTYFEPNFRHFDFLLDETAPTPELYDRVYKVPKGEMHYDERVFGMNIRSIPVLLPILSSALIVNYGYCRINSRSPTMWRWSIWPILALSFVYHNTTKWCAREKHFAMDFWRNQTYAQDEMKRLRDEQRVREEVYKSQFIDDPIAEFRVKEWLVANRQH